MYLNCNKVNYMYLTDNSKHELFVQSNSPFTKLDSKMSFDSGILFHFSYHSIPIILQWGQLNYIYAFKYLLSSCPGFYCVMLGYLLG